ncbi:hypothetical protein CISG_03120 [Coccidioides immitis RMSCC 3703]|uniref:Uncharacterized protein n=1 Tax=Coccidioides immitis RMSCC 3703 TaxID=454286 RepID=A0A0J8QJT0_COCIT|nr:hypothetical protein CISG_03120 [Coccidioides immitis RMSCC 3703]
MARAAQGFLRRQPKREFLPPASRHQLGNSTSPSPLYLTNQLRQNLSFGFAVLPKIPVTKKKHVCRFEQKPAYGAPLEPFESQRFYLPLRTERDAWGPQAVLSTSPLRRARMSSHRDILIRAPRRQEEFLQRKLKKKCGEATSLIGLV